MTYLMFYIQYCLFLFKALAQINNNTLRWLAVFYQPQRAGVFLPLNNLLNSKWFDFKIPSRSICTIIPFQHVFRHDIQYALCSNLIMFWPQGGRLVYNSTSLPSLSLIFPILFHNALNAIWITTFFNYKYLSMRVHTSHRCYMCPPFTLHSR